MFFSIVLRGLHSANWQSKLTEPCDRNGSGIDKIKQMKETMAHLPQYQEMKAKVRFEQAFRPRRHGGINDPSVVFRPHQHV